MIRRAHASRRGPASNQYGRVRQIALETLNALPARWSRPGASVIVGRMRTKPYPLEALRVLRSRAQDEAASAYKESQKALAAGQAAHARAQEAADALLECRRAALEVAPSTGGELAIAGVFASKLQREHAAAREALKQTAAEVRRLARAERLAQDKLRQAFLERQVVEKHHEKFAEAERKRLQRIEDDEMDDLIPHLMKKRPTFPV